MVDEEGIKKSIDKELKIFALVCEAIDEKTLKAGNVDGAKEFVYKTIYHQVSMDIRQRERGGLY